MKIELQYGFTRIKIEGEEGSFNLLVWDSGPVAAGQVLGRIISQQNGIVSRSAAEEIAARKIALDRGETDACIQISRKV